MRKARGTDPIHLMSSSNNLGTAILVDNVTVSEVHILGDVALTRKPIDYQNNERGTVTACDVRATCMQGVNTQLMG